MPNLITLTGPSGCGKSEIMKIMVKVNPKCVILPKFMTRPRRKDDDENVITVDKIPDECDYVYELYGEKYAISSRMILEALQQGKIPIAIINDAETIEKLQRKFGISMKSYFIHRERPSREKLIEIFNQTRGIADPEKIEERYQTAMKIYSMYAGRIDLFDNIILNTGEGFEEVTSIVKQLFDSNFAQRRLSGLYANKIFVISGGPGFGKKLLIQGANRVGVLQIPKQADRERNPSDGAEIICRGEPNYHLQDCEMQYENFGTKYGIDILPIWEKLVMTNKHQALVCSPIEILRELKDRFNEAIISIYVHSEMNIEEYIKAEQQKGSSKEYIQNRANEYYRAHKNYAEHFTEYDKSFIFTGSEKELIMQFAGVLGIQNKMLAKEEKGEARE